MKQIGFLTLLIVLPVLPSLAENNALPKEGSQIILLRPYDYVVGLQRSPGWNDIILEHQYNLTQYFYSMSQVSFVFDSTYFGMSYRGGAGIHPFFSITDSGSWFFATFSLSVFGGYHFGNGADGHWQDLSVGYLPSWRLSLARTLLLEFGLGEEYYCAENSWFAFLKMAVGYEF